jgi:fructokinase
MNRVTAVGEILFDIYPTSKKLGGAPLNFLYHVFKLTGQGNMVSRVGKDILGSNIFEFLNNNNLPVEYIQEDHLHPTGVASVSLNEKSEPTFTIDEERAYDFIEKTSLLEKLINEETDCLYFGTLAQRRNVSRETIQSLFGKNIKYFCDLNIRQKFYSKEIIETSLKAANILKVSASELKLLNDLFIKEDFETEKTARKIITGFDIDFLAVTLGGEGSLIIKKEETNHYKSKPVEIIDTVGAGDAFASIFCIGCLQNWELDKINKLANDFASELCKINGALPRTDEIYEMMRKRIENE